MSDLADRISRAAVAALDLAPFDDRYGRLSRQVLAGGASRFARVTTDDQAIHYVIPVGLAGDRIDYGALVLQDRQAGIVWRDSAGVDHWLTVPRGQATTSFASLTLGGEQWMRFDVDSPAQHLAFLVPPVNSPLLRSTLIDYFRARPGIHPPSDALPEPERELPLVRFPDPEPVPLPEPTPEHFDLEATQVIAATSGPVPDVSSPWAPMSPVMSEVDDATRIRPQFTPAPQQLDEATRVHEPPFDLYRDRPAAPPTWPQEPTQAMPPAPPAWAPTATMTEAVEVLPSGASRTTVGFLIGLLGTLAIGGAALVVRLLTG